MSITHDMANFSDYDVLLCINDTKLSNKEHFKVAGKPPFESSSIEKDTCMLQGMYAKREDSVVYMSIGHLIVDEDDEDSLKSALEHAFKVSSNQVKAYDGSVVKAPKIWATFIHEELEILSKEYEQEVEIII